MTHFESLRAKLEEITHIRAAASLLIWDQEVMMPKGGAGMRARHLSALQGLHHHKYVHEVGPLLPPAEEAAEKSGDSFEQLNLRRIRRGYDKAVKVPTEHVMEYAKLCSDALHAWVAAKKDNNFSLFEPSLAHMVDLKLRETEYLGYTDNPYDALIDQFEPDMTSARLHEIFDPFKESLSGLLMEIGDRPQVDDSFVRQHISKEAQLTWSESVLRKLGYDMNHGRQDLSAHPFTIAFNPEDVRITTMVDENDLREMLYSSVHEGGHAMYEQGLPITHFGLPAAEACSLAIHESQSRLWENNVARSEAFWAHFEPSFRALFPDKLRDYTSLDIFRAMNQVRPNLIRISSDELTYHFHIALRFEIEDDLINKRLKVKDLPEAWNAKVKSYLGLDVPGDSMGVLQDIHWSHGNIGYFPTYSLGSFYAAQFMHQAQQAIPGLDDQFRQGDFSGLKGWLGKEIHQRGRLYFAEELCEMITGEPLNVQYFIDYARDKFRRIYGIELKGA